MRRLAAAFTLLVFLAACQHRPPATPAYRIGSVVVQPGVGPYASIAAHQLHGYLDLVAQDINRQLPANAPVETLYVDLEKVRYAAPAGIFMLRRSKMSGTMKAGPWHFRFRGEDSEGPDLDEFFDLDAYYAPERSYQRIAKRLALLFSVRYSRTFHIRAIPADELQRPAPLQARPKQTMPPQGRGRAAPPPSVLTAG